jgi:hypothetical protein
MSASFRARRVITSFIDDRLKRSPTGTSEPSAAALGQKVVLGGWRASDLIPAAIAPFAALVAYLPAIVVPYGFMDDYSLLAWRRGLEGNWWTTATQFGRPLQALFFSGAYSLASDIDSLRLVRFLGLLGVMSLAVLLYYALRHSGFGKWLSTGVCLSVVSLASFQIYVAWAAVFEAPYAAILAGVASLRLHAVASPRSRAVVLRRAEATALLLCSLLIYQPAAMFFWVFVAIEVLRPNEELARAARKFRESLVVVLLALLLGYVAVRIGVHFYGGALSGRTNLVHDLTEKARWFWNQPIANSLAMSNVTPTVSAGLATTIVAAVGMLVLHADSRWGAFGFLGLAAAMVPLSYAPNLVASENFASYRTTGALASLLAFYLWLGLFGIARAMVSSTHDRARLMTQAGAFPLAALLSFVLLALSILPLARPESRVSIHALASWPVLLAFALLFGAFVGGGLWSIGHGSRPWPAVAIGGLAVTTFVLCGLLIAARNVTTLVVVPQSVELQMMRSALNERGTPEPRHVVFVKANSTQGAAPLVRYDEFGQPSSYFAWVPSPEIRLVLRERVPDANPMIDVLAWDQIREARALHGDVFVDMRKLRKRRVGWSLWTLHAARRPTVARAPSVQRR